MNEILKVSHLQKSYNDRCVVDDVSFSIQKGECFGLLGHNGAGKSTLLECILQVKKKDKGDVQLFHQTWKKNDKKMKERIGVQFQESNYPERMKVKEACELTASMYPQTNDIKTMLAQFKLVNFANHYINELSGGERQRLTILLAMLPNPDILFLDELTTGLDVQARRELWTYIELYKQQGKSIVLTSHYMDEVETLCEHITILKAGRQVFIGTIAEAKQLSGHTTLEEAYLWFHKEDAI